VFLAHPGEPYPQPFVRQQFGGRNSVRPILGRSAAATVSVIIALAVFFGGPATAVGAPSTAAIRAKQTQAAAADAKLQDLSADLELKQTDLQAVKDALAGTRAEISATEARLADAQAKLDESQAILASRADAIYRSGSTDFLTVLLGTTDFEDFVTRLDLLNRITSADADLIVQVSSDRDRVAQARAALLNRESEQIALRAESQARELAAQAAADRQKSYLASLSAEIKKLVKQEEDRLARVAADLARRAAEAASHPSTRPSDAGSLGASHPDAVAVAKKLLGVPYLWGGTTVRGFDCSGFVQYCYAQIGIRIPRTSRVQYTFGQFIPASRTDLLEPGDLVFFAYGGDPKQVHHVGMYVGGGVFIHAPGTGDHVKYSSLSGRISTRGDYVGAVRP
jgi:cell wall-associated NlpC family hydrolase